MADRVREQLLGYLLGALDESEHIEVEGQLARDPQLRKELALVRVEIEPLRRGRPEFDLPFGLAARTCESIFAQPGLVPSDQEDGRTKLTRARVPPEPVAAPVSGWSLADLGVAAGIVVAAILLIFPAIANSRYTTRILQCQNNLRQFGMALVQYSRDHQGYFPAVPAQGPLAFAGVLAPQLREAGYIDDPSLVWCPSCSREGADRGPMPSIEDLLRAPPGKLRRLRNWAGGDYAYPLGYWQNGRHHPTRNLGRRDFVILADVSQLPEPDRGSLNHGGEGQNVVFEDCHIAFLTLPWPAGRRDNFYVNDLGALAAGQGPRDCVVGPSGVVPVRLSLGPVLWIRQRR